MHGYDVKEAKGTAAVLHGKKRGLVFDPLEAFELLRDTWDNIPIPNDARFEAVSIESVGHGSYICFYYSTDTVNREKLIVKPSDANLSPLGHCVSFKPQTLVNILKYWFDGMVPSDAEATSFYINKMFSLLCIEVSSDKWPSSDALKMPMLHLTYDGERMFLLNDKGEQRAEKVN